MRMDGQDESRNVEDRRGGGGGGMRLGGRGGLGLGSIVIALIAGWVFGINPLTVLGLLEGGAPAPQVAPAGRAAAPPADDPEARFVSQVLRSTEQVWGELFLATGQPYQAPKLVLFRQSYPTACGRGEAAMGPFYCPGDEKVYIDLSFYETMKRQLGAPGDFAQAYVIAHEVGHHVQHLLGLTERIDRQRGRISQAQQNALSVRLELQADCFAGVWAHHSQRRGAGWRLEPGDIEEALNAASQIGDDKLQGRGGGPVRQETFTHGSSAQRVEWFSRGLKSGSVPGCNTFEGARL